eukprot:gnl/MRDRNA2_/MRDRNA2_88373_c0_seq1.p1 gnl/MRDRNA2_/MRDRNA2_88373_c0~~gnl/MRDRNA2_/MRDRNA2_88373_c0_seq1.p1  ORF type:complete len:424 (-),score=87.99 gnl/MRDRNA2_/MRDRNA2_88373_c0_seq1:130-1401(-)
MGTDASLVDAHRKTMKEPLSTFRKPSQNKDVLRVYDKACLEQGIEGEEDIKPPEITEKDTTNVQKAPQPSTRNMKEVKMASCKIKMAEAEERRKEDQKDLRARVEKLRQMREQRFERLTDGIFENEKLIMEAASILRSKEADDLRRKSSLYKDWDGDIYQNIADQLHSHLNPFNRNLRQELRGTKSVEFQPKKDFHISCPGIKDPLKRSLHATGEEDFFHRTARTVLGRNPQSMSCPDLSRTMPNFASMGSPVQGTSGDPGMRASSSSSNIKVSDSPFIPGKTTSVLFSPNRVHLPRGRCKPTFEQTSWGQMKLQDTLYGHFAQICEHGPGFARLIRSGDNVFIPDESDGISAAGKIRTRFGGHNDLGILKGQECSRGESSRYKNDAGSSSGGPSQDHYTFDTSGFATEVEFPLGKRMYAHMH